MRHQDWQAEVGEDGPGGAAQHEFAESIVAIGAHDEQARIMTQRILLQRLPDGSSLADPLV